MKRPMLVAVLVAVGVLLCGTDVLCPAVSAADGVVLSPASRRLLSQLQSMGHEYHSAAEWNRVIEQIQATIDEAEQAGDAEEMISITLILADVYSEMLGQHQRALALLTDLRAELGSRSVAGIPRLYAAQAEVYARMGDEAAILDLIEAFKAGPHYDPRHHPIEGGESPSVPVTVTRPAAGGDDSLTVTMMNRSAREARLAVGRTFPAFETVDTSGRALRLSDFRGRVLLLDFYVRGWRAWEDSLPVKRELYARRHGHGFDILGVCLEPRTEGLDAYLAEHDVTWRQVAGDASLAHKLGVGGGAVSFLLDRDGRIVGRDLTGGDLTAAVNRLLSP